MSRQIRASDLFVALSDEQQELVTGSLAAGAMPVGSNGTFSLNSNQVVQAMTALQGVNITGGQGGTNVLGAVSLLGTAAQNFYNSGVGGFPAATGASNTAASGSNYTAGGAGVLGDGSGS